MNVSLVRIYKLNFYRRWMQIEMGFDNAFAAIVRIFEISFWTSWNWAWHEANIKSIYSFNEISHCSTRNHKKLSKNVSRDHPILNLAIVIFPHSSPVLLLLIKLHLLVSANFVFAVNEVILNKKRGIFFWIYSHEFSWFLIKYLL